MMGRLGNRVKSAYIHIPFCNTICSYCDFCKVYYKNNLIDSYLDSLDIEINKYYKGEILDTIYIGGGTPSCLSIDKLNRLFGIIDKLKKSDNLEFTFECNLEDINEELLILLKKRS